MIDNVYTDVYTKVYDKAKVEQNTYINNLLRKNPKEIICAAYEKVIRDEILLMIKYRELSIPCMEYLSTLKYPIAQCYDAWLKSDCSYVDMIRDSIEDFVNENNNDMNDMMEEVRNG